MHQLRAALRSWVERARQGEDARQAASLADVHALGGAGAVALAAADPVLAAWDGRTAAQDAGLRLAPADL